jgi:hypothetical protein
VPFSSPFALTDSPGHVCGKCRDLEPAFDSARAAGLYEGALREIIHAYKYDGVSGLSATLGKLMAGHFRDRFPDEVFDVITHVPLHPKRFRERGFDQACFWRASWGGFRGFRRGRASWTAQNGTPPSSSSPRSSGGRTSAAPSSSGNPARRRAAGFSWWTTS